MHTLTRRHVLATLSGSAVLLCPALLNAQSVDVPWGDVETTAPVGADIMMLGAGPARVDVSALAPGEVAVVGRPTEDEAYAATGMIQYIGILHRTPDQIAYGAANDRAGVVQDPAYLVVALVCPHRGKAIGVTGDPVVPFACTDRGNRHSSNFDASGFGIGGASEGDPMTIPDYTISGAVVSLA